MERNMELGVLLRGGQVPSLLDRHPAALITIHNSSERQIHCGAHQITNHGARSWSREQVHRGSTCALVSAKPGQRLAAASPICQAHLILPFPLGVWLYLSMAASGTVVRSTPASQRPAEPFWLQKLPTTRRGPPGVDCELRRLGWRVLRLWEHDLKNPQRCLDRLANVFMK